RHVNCGDKPGALRDCADRVSPVAHTRSAAEAMSPDDSGARPRNAHLQTDLRRPLSKLMIRSTNPTTSSKWIRPPPTCKLKPRSHKIRRTTKMVQSISPSCTHLRAHEF